MKILEALLATPSPSGFCMEIVKRVRAETEKLGFALETTPKGNVVITLPGADCEAGGTLALTAHVDTLGAMVRSIKPNGMLRFTSVGGYAMQTVEGEYCLVHTRDGRTYEGTVLSTQPSVHVYADVRDQKREEANMEIRSTNWSARRKRRRSSVSLRETSFPGILGPGFCRTGGSNLGIWTTRRVSPLCSARWNG